MKATHSELRTIALLRRMTGATIQAIHRMVDMRDPYTGTHQRRTADLSRGIAGKMGLTEDETDGIRMAALIHDIGKIVVPAELLSMPRRLSSHEFEIIKDHVPAGYQILKEIDFPWPIARIVLQHHERMDGSGYPNGLKGDSILIEARIIGIADVVETMSSHRPYRPSLGVEQALSEIDQNRGTLYDPDVVGACMELFQKDGFRFKVPAPTTSPAFSGWARDI